MKARQEISIGCGFLATAALRRAAARRPSGGRSAPSYEAGPAGLAPAGLVGTATTGELRRGPRLVLRVTAVYLMAFLRSGSSRDVSSDSVTGEALVVGPRGEILARDPQHAALGAHARATEPNEPGRAVAVARHSARWLRWTMG